MFHAHSTFYMHGFPRMHIQVAIYPENVILRVLLRVEPHECRPALVGLTHSLDVHMSFARRDYEVLDVLLGHVVYVLHADPCPRVLPYPRFSCRFTLCLLCLAVLRSSCLHRRQHSWKRFRWAVGPGC